MDREIITLLQELVRTPSVNPPGDEHNAARVLANWLTARGVQVELIPVHPGRSNLLARVSGTGSGPALALCGHLDTVPIGSQAWQHDPFAGEIVQGRMYGRGTADMKGGLAAMAGALAVLAQSTTSLPRDVFLMATVGEEVDCSGARAFVKQDAFDQVGAIVIGEPTALEIGIAHKGALWLNVTVGGASAHGSMPSLGSNAILNTTKFLHALEQFDFRVEAHPLLGLPTTSPDQIEGGSAPNVVPDRCSVTIDVRTIPPLAHASVLDEIRQLLDKTIEQDRAALARLEVLLDRAPLDTSPSDPFVRAALVVGSDLSGTRQPKGFTYFTDASIIVQSYQIPIIIWGPGEPGQAHRADESILLESVLTAARAYTKLALDTGI